MKRKAIIVLLLVFALSQVFAAMNFKALESVAGKQKGDRFGTVLSNIGDINGDGYGDFAVGSPGSYTIKSYSGEVFIYLGGNEFNNKPAMVLKGEAASDLFGSAISTLGDINGDGFDDFAIGAPRNDASFTDAGKVYIYHGAKDIPSKPVMSLTGSRANDWYGIAICGGVDLNNDSRNDMIIGASYAGKKYSGSAYVYLGGSDFKSAALEIEGERPGDNFGSVIIAPGDLSGDAVVDFVVSASYSDANNTKNVGSVYVFKGGSVISKSPWVTLHGKVEDENYGYSLASAGDVNGDEIMDFVVGSLNGGARGEGAAYVFTGGQVIRPNPFMEIYGANPKDMTGRAVYAAGDVNNDGYSDIFVGSPYSDTGYYRNGRVDIYFGGKEADILSDYHILGEGADTQCGFSITRVPKFFGRRGDLYLFGCPGKESGFADYSKIMMYK